MALMFKAGKKTFAVLATREEEYLILKCEPALIGFLRGQYNGIGHRSHLDPRHWIGVSLDADGPPEEIESLAARSYELVCAGLSRTQKAELGRG